MLLSIVLGMLMILPAHYLHNNNSNNDDNDLFYIFKRKCIITRVKGLEFGVGIINLNDPRR